MKLRYLIALTCLALTTKGVQADPMQNVFDDMYSTSAPSASKHGNGRYGVNLGGFSYRPNLGETSQLASARLPNANIGPCGEIDLFAGSFSFISGDELAQLARGIMQGAASYAFQLALESISPMSAGVMKDLRELMNKMNALNIDGCKAGADLMSKALTQDDLPVASEMTFLGDNIRKATAAVGVVSDHLQGEYGPTRQESLTDLASKVGKEVVQNSTIDTLKNTRPTGTFFDSFGGIDANEIALTIFGGTIISSDLSMCANPPKEGDTECTTYLPPKGAEFFANFFINLDDINSDVEKFTFSYYKCTNPKCTSAVETPATADRLLPKLRQELYKVWQKSYKNPEVEYTPSEQNIVYWFGNDMVTMMQIFGAEDQFGQSYARYKSLEGVAYIMDTLAIDLYNKTKEAITVTKSKSNFNKLFPVGLSQTENDVKEFHVQYNQLRDDEIMKRVYESRHALGTSLNIHLSSKG